MTNRISAAVVIFVMIDYRIRQIGRMDWAGIERHPVVPVLWEAVLIGSTAFFCMWLWRLGHDADRREKKA